RMRASGSAVSVLICTYNRARLLTHTLESLRRIHTARPWDVLVVDNNSTDDTAAVVRACAPGYPVPLRYAFEGRQGKSHALNTGIGAIESELIAFTDDDVRVAPGWLDAACDALSSDASLDYAG